MKAKGIVTTLLLGFAGWLSAQDTVYIDKKYQWVKDKAQAVEYGVISKEGKLTRVAFYTLDGLQKGFCEYSKYGADPAKRVRNGKSVYLYTDGTDSLTANYVKNKLEGNMTYYYPGGQVKTVRFMEKGLIQKITQYYETGKLRREETFEHAPLKSKGGMLYDPDGKEMEFVSYFTNPVFPGGREEFARQVGKYLKYPQEALSRKSEGKVYVDFVIGRDGKIRNPRISMSSNDAGMEKAVLNAFGKVAETYQCTPAMEDGVPVRIKYTFPITFRL